jgi:hypothetical protein
MAVKASNLFDVVLEPFKNFTKLMQSTLFKRDVNITA